MPVRFHRTRYGLHRTRYGLPHLASVDPTEVENLSRSERSTARKGLHREPNGLNHTSSGQRPEFVIDLLQAEGLLHKCASYD